MDIIFFQQSPLHTAVGWGDGGLKRLDVMVDHWRSTSEVIDTIQVVALDDDFEKIKLHLGRRCEVLPASGNDALPVCGDRLVIVTEPNFHVPVTLLRRLKIFTERNIGRKVVKLNSRHRASTVGLDCQVFTRELTSLLREKGRTVQGVMYGAWTQSDLVYEETIFSTSEDEREAYRQKLDMTIFPSELALEPTTHCNLACTMCTYHSDKYKSPRVGSYVPKEEFRHMDVELFKRLIDEAAAMNVTKLCPQYRGEPFLHPSFMEMLEYAISKGVTNIAFPTNGTSLNEKNARRLVDMGLHTLQFSIDALSKDAYLDIRINSDFERVQENLRNIIEYRDSKGLTHPVIGLTFVDLPENVSEREDYIRHYSGLVDFIRTSVGVSYAELHSGLPGEYFECPDDWRPPCRLITEQIAVSSDGIAGLCHPDSTKSHVIGDLNKQSLQEVFNGRRLRDIWDAHLEKSSSVPQICDKCQIWKADIFRDLPSFDPDNVSVTGGPMWVQYYKLKPQPTTPTVSTGLVWETAQRIINKAKSLVS